jgi:rifampin ADP-ribosylating transferase
VNSSRNLDSGRFYHGTKADLKVGSLLEAGRRSNFGQGAVARFVYLTSLLDTAVWGAELAAGSGAGRIYLVEPTGPIEDDPNVTDKKAPGNPTASYRTRDPLVVTGEVVDWEGHAPEVLRAMLGRLDEIKRQEIEAIND